jgi:general secretion pathway protein C
MEMDVILEQAWLKRLLKYLPIVISAVAVIILGILLSQLVWLWLTPKYADANIQVISAVDTKQTEAVKRIQYGQQIAELHLFGVADKKPVAKQTTIKKITPVTRLNLKLHGTFAYTNQKGFAVISGVKKKQKTYEKGDKIDGTNNITLQKIYPDYVTLDRDGKEEILKLPKNKTLSNKSRPPPVISAPKIATRPNPQTVPAESAPSVVDPNNLEGLRQNLLKNPSKLMNIVRAEAVKEGDKFMGFRLNPGKDSKTFNAMGFKAGDVVISVNGTTIDNPAQGLSIMQTLTTADSIAVTVKRGEEIITLDGIF